MLKSTKRRGLDKLVRDADSVSFELRSLSELSESGKVLQEIALAAVNAIGTTRKHGNKAEHLVDRALRSASEALSVLKNDTGMQFHLRSQSYMTNATDSILSDWNVVKEEMHKVQDRKASTGLWSRISEKVSKKSSANSRDSDVNTTLERCLVILESVIADAKALASVLESAPPPDYGTSGSDTVAIPKSPQSPHRRFGSINKRGTVHAKPTTSVTTDNLRENVQDAKSTLNAPSPTESTKRSGQQSGFQPPSVPSRPALSKATVAKPLANSAPSLSTHETQKPAPPLKVFNFIQWEHKTVEDVLQVTLDANVAIASKHEIVFLRGLESELRLSGEDEYQRLTEVVAERLLIARLELDMTATSGQDSFLVALYARQTKFEYLASCWKRQKSSRSAMKKIVPPDQIQPAMIVLGKLRDMVVRYAGWITLRPNSYPQSARPCSELVSILMSLSIPPQNLFATPVTFTTACLTVSDIEGFLHDMANEFEQDDEFNTLFAMIIRQLLFHPCLEQKDGLNSADERWRGIMRALEILTSIKSIAAMITSMDEWNPPGTTAAAFEKLSLMGPLCRLGLFPLDWMAIAQTYFSEPEILTWKDIQWSYNTLRGTLKSLQSSLFQIFNSIVRASPQSREAVLQYFATAIFLNMQCEKPTAGTSSVPMTTSPSDTFEQLPKMSSESFLTNLHSILLRFAEPFIDAYYTKLDRVDPLYCASSPRLSGECSLREQSDRSQQPVAFCVNYSSDSPASPPNFITEIFYLTLASGHYGYLPAISSYEDIWDRLGVIQQRLNTLHKEKQSSLDEVLTKVSSLLYAISKADFFARKSVISKVQTRLLACKAQLLDPELVSRSVSFNNFASTWVIRIVDPIKKHPEPLVTLPLPKDIPMSFDIIPKYILNDIAKYYLFVTRNTPDSLRISGKDEVVQFSLTFLASSWHIDPAVKANIIAALDHGTTVHGQLLYGVLGDTLNRNRIALKHFIPALVQVYVEREEISAAQMPYSKFTTRTSIVWLFSVAWNNPDHRRLFSFDVIGRDNFNRFVCLMLSDTAYIMNYSLAQLAQIHSIQTEMANGIAWAQKSPENRQEQERKLRQLEMTTPNCTGAVQCAIALIKDITTEVKEPFTMPEIATWLAVKLDYFLKALVGPRYQNLKVKEPEKLRFDPTKLLGNVLQIYINLSEWNNFAKAVARDRVLYYREDFRRGADIARKRVIKTEVEIEKLDLFVLEVERIRATMRDPWETAPREFFDPLVSNIMLDPVRLPSSQVVVDRSTIVFHLKLEPRDPFNRQPLTEQELLPEHQLKERICQFRMRSSLVYGLQIGRAIPVD